MLKQLEILADTGETLYAYPTDQSLVNWTTHRVAWVEQGSPNAGLYRATLDTDKNYGVFVGTAMPTGWNQALTMIGAVALTADNFEVSAVAKLNSVR
jgi:hypothetical protein